MSVRTYGIYSILGLFISFFAISTWLSLSRNIELEADVFKYISVFLIFLTVLVLKKRGNSDLIATSGLAIFITMLSIFTLINFTEWQDLLILSGYYLCFLIYFFISKSNHIIQLKLRDSLFYLSIIFVIINIFFISDPTAYSPVKGQFSGFLDNTNAFTGLCGLFFVLNFSSFSFNEGDKKRSLYIVLMIILSLYLLLGGSRGSILSTIVSSVFILSSSKNKKLIIIFLTIFVIVFFIFNDTSSLDTPDRDIFEDTGRGSIFASYWNELSERYFYIGTGVSLNAGRMKTELSYFDIFLMTGFIGFFGFMIFILRTLYISLLLKNTEATWLTAVFIYIIFSSIFEGYAANIMSLISILIYIVSAMIYTNYKALIYESSITINQ